MENLSQTNRIDEWKRVLSKFSGYTSILAARKEYINYIDKQIYEKFKENYNKIIEDIQLDERRRKQNKKQRQKQQEKREKNVKNQYFHFLMNQLNIQAKNSKNKLAIINDLFRLLLKIKLHLLMYHNHSI